MKALVATSVLSGSSSNPSSSPERILPGSQRCIHIEIYSHPIFSFFPAYQGTSIALVDGIVVNALSETTVGGGEQEIIRQVTSRFLEKKWTAGRPSPCWKWQGKMKEKQEVSGRKAAKP